MKSKLAFLTRRIFKKSYPHISSDYWIQSSCFADVTIKCDGVSIPAHNLILSARSPVFAAMFANPMKESRENEVEITDIDVSTIRALLIFMYTGKTSQLTASSVADLMFAADKYQLPGLKTACSYFLKDSKRVADPRHRRLARQRIEIRCGGLHLQQI
ncbi:TD and POZ domain-containing protein 3 [Araneus ventricosus]|uniref:TD and POZ domain-containing protein 3 n=1 Tax=Araneus ventricosus TaxID=182803 RepID=A0A4Y2V8B3_ARAVE|nr:TD and POZ domain-containing protein 3 [Araneus ventricosus]